MHILLAADQYPEYRNGAGAFTEQLAAGLAARRHRVTLAYPAVDGRRRSSSRCGLRDERFSSVPLPLGHGLRVCPPARARIEVKALLDELTRGDEPVDVVHVQSHLPLGRTVAAAARSHALPVVATNHFMPENLLPHLPVPASIGRLLSRLAWHDLGRVFGAADLITTPTERAADLLTAATGLPRAEVVSNGVDLSRFLPRSDHPGPEDTSGADAPVVLFVGRLEEEKRVEDLLRGFAALPRPSAARLVYIGTGSRHQALVDLAHTYGVADRVEFWGNVSDERLRAAYATCTVFCAPGVAELQSLVTLEAVASGAPVLAADAVALPHLVRHGVNGFLYPPDRPGELTALLARLLADRALRAAMGEQSRRVALRHDLGTTVELFEDHYRRLITARTGRPADVPAPATTAPSVGATDADLVALADLVA